MFGKGQFYCYPNASYSVEPFSGTLVGCEIALGLKPTQRDEVSTDSVICVGSVEVTMFTVTLRFQHPAWDEAEGIPYRDIAADSKQEANELARDRATADGHLGTSKGRYWFSAEQQ
jgi:hypothetical protein